MGLRAKILCTAQKKICVYSRVHKEGGLWITFCPVWKRTFVCGKTVDFQEEKPAFIHILRNLPPFFSNKRTFIHKILPYTRSCPRGKVVSYPQEFGSFFLFWRAIAGFWKCVGVIHLCFIHIFPVDEVDNPYLSTFSVDKREKWANE